MTNAPPAPDPVMAQNRSKTEKNLFPVFSVPHFGENVVITAMRQGSGEPPA